MSADGEESIADLEAQLTARLQSHKDGLSSSDLTDMTRSITAEDRSGLINRIIEKGNVEMLQIEGRAGFILRYRNSTVPSNMKPDERVVYSIIEESETAGIWIRDIRERSGLTDVQIRRVLKALEQRKLVKSIKAVGTTKKCYILYDVNADDALTGGIFYADQQLDSQFVNTLVQVCISLLQTRQTEAAEKFPQDRHAQQEHAYLRADSVAQYIHERGVSKVQLSIADVESVLNTAMLDGKVEKRYDNAYRAVSRQPFHSALVSVPCFYCSMRDECAPGHRISPESCVYMRESFEI